MKLEVVIVFFYHVRKVPRQSSQRRSLILCVSHLFLFRLQVLLVFLPAHLLSQSLAINFSITIDWFAFSQRESFNHCLMFESHLEGTTIKVHNRISVFVCSFKNERLDVLNCRFKIKILCKHLRLPREMYRFSIASFDVVRTFVVNYL